MDGKSLLIEYLKNEAVRYLWQLIGSSFENPIELISEVFQSVELEISEENLKSVNDLYLRFKHSKPKQEQGYAGCLIFWFDSGSGRARHVDMMISKYHVIGYIMEKVRMRPLQYRGENYKIIDPFLGDEDAGADRD